MAKAPINRLTFNQDYGIYEARIGRRLFVMMPNRFTPPGEVRYRLQAVLSQQITITGRKAVGVTDSFTRGEKLCVLYSYNTLTAHPPNPLRGTQLMSTCSDCLFASRTHRPLSPRDIQRMVQKAAFTAGLH